MRIYANVPLPPDEEHSYWAWMFSRLQPGDSFLVDLSYTNKTIHAAATKYRQRVGHNFTIRVMRDVEHHKHRVWRKT